VLASASALSSLHFNVNDPSQSPGPIASTPPPPGFPPLSFEDGSKGQVAVAMLTSTGHSSSLSSNRALSLTGFVHAISFLNPSSHAFFHPLSRFVFDRPNRIELQINPPRLQQATKPSADQASVRYHLCDCTEVSYPRPLFNRTISYTHSQPSIRTSDPWLLHAGMFASLHAPVSRFLKRHLRIGLRCFYSSRCRVPARISISGKDFPLPFCTDNNQPFLISFFFPFICFPTFCSLRSTRAS